MAIYSFIKEAGAKLFGIEKEKVEESNEVSSSSEAKAQKEDVKAASRLKNRVAQAGLEVKNVKVEIEGDMVIVSGSAKNQAAREKAILLLGNSEGIAKVDDNLQVEDPSRESAFHTVERDDTLQKIAQDRYGDEHKDAFILEANKPVLEAADKIYPGLVLRIPELEA